MFKFLQSFNSKSKPSINGKEVWATVSKSPAERRKNNIFKKTKRAFIEAGYNRPDQVRIDYRRGVILVNKTRVAEWTGDAGNGNLGFKSENLL